MRLSQLLAEAGGDRAEAARRAGIGRSTMYRWLKQGLAEEPLRGITGADVISMSCEVTDGRITTYRTTVNIAFALERE